MTRRHTIFLMEVTKYHNIVIQERLALIRDHYYSAKVSKAIGLMI